MDNCKSVAFYYLQYNTMHKKREKYERMGENTAKK